MRSVPDASISLDVAVDHSRTGDLWLFRGPSATDRAIQVVTGSPVNHVGMAVVIDDLPPLIWHADAGRLLRDLWTGTRHAGAQLHDLRSAVLIWAHRYRQRAWLRQLDHPVDREAENAVLRTVAALDGAPYPSTVGLASGWLRERARRVARTIPGRTTALDCAQAVAHAYDAMGLLPPGPPPTWYDPGKFWSGRGPALLRGARLGGEIRVRLPSRKGRHARAL